MRGLKCLNRRLGALSALFGVAVIAAPARAATVELAPHVHADLGSYTAITPENRGEIGNAGLIIGHDAALAIDSGVSRVQGERLFAAWTAVTDRPLSALLLTQPNQEFIFGVGAFRDRKIPVFAHRDAARLMQQRCEGCLTHLRELLPGGLMRGTALIIPDRLIDAGADAPLGDRRVRLIDGGAATTPGTLAVFDVESRTLFAGGLIAHRRIPSLRDARVDAWIKALDGLRALQPARIVPGFGPVGGIEQIEAMQRYLRSIDAAVRSQYERGASLLEAAQAVTLPAFEDWQEYATLHPQNVQYLYRQLEDAEFR